MLATAIGDSWLSLPKGFLKCSLDCNKDKSHGNVDTLIFMLLTLGFSTKQREINIYYFIQQIKYIKPDTVGIK